MDNCPWMAGQRLPRGRARVVNAGSCPDCTPATFDATKARMVKSMTKGVHLGLGPGNARGSSGGIVEDRGCGCNIL